MNDTSNIHYLYTLRYIKYTGDFLNADLGVPYETIMKKAIEKGYAGNQTEVLRQALLNYERMIEEEEKELVTKAVKIEMGEVKAGTIKTKPFGEVKKKFGW
ncbi:MAG: hypothetical protein NUV57_02070 [archaeon]|nr:hypothetical protein [archaeon]